MKARITFILILATSISFGQTWEKLNYSFPKIFLGVMNIYSSPNNVLVAGFANKSEASFISMDGGTTWQQIFADKAISTVKFAPDGTIYLFSARKIPNVNSYIEDSIYKSPDGINWTAMNFIPKDEHHFITSNNTLLFSKDLSGGTGSKVISKSTDGGANWTLTAVGSGHITASHSADTIITTTMSPWPGTIEYSHDGGVTVNNTTSWNDGGSIPQMTPNGDIYAAAVGKVFKSTDGGINFTQLTLNSSVSNIQDFMYSSGNFFIRVNGGIWQTTDFANVTAATAGIPDWQLTMDMAVSNNYLYAITDTNIYRLAIANVASIIEERDLLNSAVYPNPFSDKATITIDNHYLTHAELEIYNVQGKLMMSIDKLSGNSFEIQRNNLPAGIYFYHIKEDLKTQTRGNFIVE